MRASRLLLMLLLLQNRGRMTAAQLANELDVSRRTVLRDIEALGEAGLPVVVHRGPRGGSSSASATAPGSPGSRRTRPRPWA